jgi:hypothetical protein
MIGTAYSIGVFVVSVFILLTLNYWWVRGPVQVPSPRPPGPEPAASLSYALGAQLVISAILLVMRATRASGKSPGSFSLCITAEHP